MRVANSRFVRLAWAAAGLCVAGAGAHAAQVQVAAELSQMASTYGFTITGEEHVQDAVGRAEGEDPYQRLRLLLERFDSIIVQGPDGRIERVIVLGRATPGNAPPKTVIDTPDSDAEGDEPAEDGAGDAKEVQLPTIRSGNQHSVRVSLEGADGKRVEQVLLVDTGADTLVLPASLIPRLGIAEDRLKEREVQTANGRAQARSGALPGIWLGEQRVGDVAVAFLDDDKLGGPGLLGMSVLGRYQMTIDDEHGTLTLTQR